MLNGPSGVSSRSQLGQTEAPGQRRDTLLPGGALGGGVKGELSWSRREPRLSFNGSFCMLGMKGIEEEILKEDCTKESKDYTSVQSIKGSQRW